MTRSPARDNRDPNHAEASESSLLPDELTQAGGCPEAQADGVPCEEINDCDGYECIRWRIWLISNLISNQRARLLQVDVPVVDANP